MGGRPHETAQVLLLLQMESRIDLASPPCDTKDRRYALLRTFTGDFPRKVGRTAGMKAVVACIPMGRVSNSHVAMAIGKSAAGNH